MYASSNLFKSGKTDVCTVGHNYLLDNNCKLLRSPAASKASIDADALKPDVPGVFKIGRPNASEDPMRLVAFPEAAIAALEPFAAPSAIEGILLSLARGTSTEQLDALTETHPIPACDLARFGADKLPSQLRKASHAKAAQKEAR